MDKQIDQTESDANTLASNRSSTVRQVITPRAAWFASAGSFAVSILFFYEWHLGLSYRLGAIFFCLCGCVFLSATSGRCKAGVILSEGGFEQFLGLWPPRKIQYSDIVRIEAVQSGGGAQGDEVYLILRGTGKSVRLGEGDLFSTDLHKIIFELPGFQRDQYSLAADHKLKGREHFFFKGYVVFEKG